jgi:hypothetical protein
MISRDVKSIHGSYNDHMLFTPGKLQGMSSTPLIGTNVHPISRTITIARNSPYQKTPTNYMKRFYKKKINKISATSRKLVGRNVVIPREIL